MMISRVTRMKMVMKLTMTMEERVRRTMTKITKKSAALQAKRRGLGGW